jgi:hypothetical protein
MVSLATGASRPEPFHHINRITDTNYLVIEQLTSSNLESNYSTDTLISNTPPKKRRKHTPHPYSPGELGKWAMIQGQELARLGWDKFFAHHQTPIAVNPTIRHITHPAAQYLHRLACAGVHTPLPSHWTRAQCDAAFQ